MVEKKTLVLALLAALVWAFLATSFMGYYYLEHLKFKDQVDEKQRLMENVKSEYEKAFIKRNMLFADYGSLLGEYQWFQGENYSSLMDSYGELLSNLKGNYTSLLESSPDLNETYSNILSEFQALGGRGTVSREEFGTLLNDFYKLLTSLVMKELENYTGQIGTIKVSLCIDYGNQTVVWHNVSTPAGTTLFALTQNIAKVEYSYWPTMEPGHILIDSINGYADGYWIWYYWDEAKNDWVWGPVGCDAWILKDNGIYKWACVKY
ncbi:MAG: hypothetical protein QW667_04010 [Candidatus Bathyarchaeia archaeon]